MKYTDINAETINRWADGGWEWAVPVTHEVYQAARQGKWDVLLSPNKSVPREWFGPFLRDGRLDGVRILGLACGGGQQMPVFAALGADCVVLDYSERQLDQERYVSAREGYDIRIVRADMTERLPFEDEAFDIVFNPVSNCYVEDVYHVWNECYRVLRRGGTLLAGMDNGYNFLFEDYTARPLVVTNRFPVNPLKDPGKMMAGKDEGIQFSHTLEEQIGGQLKAGFRLTDVYEDTNNDAESIADGIPAFWVTRAEKA
ncbi:MAG: class I SAM-dependent methyltransferase [Oscillospiraceae bacterium]|jgi:SAM-dependent methyltransferase|nr:class I SAM-dependent methyltransferase [Oscillospiraceae bacterium]